MGRFGPIGLVARREIVTRFQTKAYRLSTLVLVGLAVATVVGADVLPRLLGESEHRIGLLPEAAALHTPLSEAAMVFDEDMVLVELPDRAAAEAALDAGDVDAVVAAGDLVLFLEGRDSTIEGMVTQAVYQALLPERAAALGITEDDARQLATPPVVDSQVLRLADEEADGAARALSSVATIVLVLALMFYGQWVIVGVIEEKSSRIVEVLLATLQPWQLLVGKVLGILVLAVTQIVAGAAALLVTIMVMSDAELPALALNVILMSALWLILGLLLYSFLYAALGATVSRPDEAASVSTPLTVLVMGGYVAGLTYVPSSPDAIASRVLSLVPFTAPLTMPARVAAGGGSALEIVLAVALILVAIVAAIWVGSRIYTGGVLRTQKVGVLAAFRGSRDIG